MRLMGCVCVLLALVGFLTACEEEDALQGSLTEVYDTSFDTTRARLYPTELAIEYVRSDGQVPVRLTLKRDGVGGALVPGRYVLDTVGGVTGRSGEVDMPPLVGGSLTLDSFSMREGAEVQGSFDARFQTGEETSSLGGDFKASLEIIASPEGYGSAAYPPGRTCVGAVPLVLGEWSAGVLEEGLSDDVDTTCGAGGVDFVRRFEVEAPEVAEDEDVEPEKPVFQVQLRLEEGVRASLMQGSCERESLRLCALEETDEEVMLGPGVWYLVLEGQGAYEARVRRR